MTTNKVQHAKGNSIMDSSKVFIQKAEKAQCFWMPLHEGEKKLTFFLLTQTISFPQQQ